MTRQEALEKTLHLFRRYYNINTDETCAPFAAEAEFQSHEEGYFLVKMAKVSENDSAEYVFFASEEELTEERFSELDETAWNRGLERAKPCYGHKSTDVTLVILADAISDELKQKVRKQKHYKSYRYTLYGFSQYRLVAVELRSGEITTNRRGDYLKKLMSNIFKNN